ncbi:TPA: hypothetical protein O8L86_004589 [Enterobacter kobei]|nr:hypothetical protein [Enterobacter kobei]
MLLFPLTVREVNHSHDIFGRYIVAFTQRFLTTERIALAVLRPDSFLLTLG